MALAKNLEDLLKFMSPEDAQKQRALWEANPAIMNAVDQHTVPQAEFSRQLNVKDTELKTNREYTQKIKEWETKNRPIFDRATADLATEREKAAELQRKLDAAAQRRPGETGDIDGEDLEARVAKRLEGRMATDETVRRIIAEERTKMVDEMSAKMTETLAAARKQFLEETFPMATNFQADLLEVMQEYRSETGKALDRKAFSEHMQATKEVDPKKAFETFMSPVRTEKKINDEVDKRVKDALSKQNMPGVTPGQTVPTDLGPLQLKIAGETPKYREGSELGDRSAASLAAAELRQEGNF